MTKICLCRLDGYDGPLDTDDDEVYSVQWLSLQHVRDQAAANEHNFTSWLVAEMQRMDWLLHDAAQAMHEPTALSSVS